MTNPNTPDARLHAREAATAWAKSWLVTGEKWEERYVVSAFVAGTEFAHSQLAAEIVEPVTCPETGMRCENMQPKCGGCIAETLTQLASKPDAPSVREALIRCRDRFFPINQLERDRDEDWNLVNGAIASSTPPDRDAAPADVVLTEKLARLLREMRDACKANPTMQGREYVSLGIAVNNALDDFESRLLAAGGAQAVAELTEPIGTVQVMGSYQGRESLGCLLTKRAETFLRPGDKLYAVAQPSAWAVGEGEPSAWSTVKAERLRQRSAEGWTPEHDDEHEDGQMAAAAACYALHTEPVGNVRDYLRYWPWAAEWWKPKDRRSNLVRAAALLLAEIERLDRAATSTPGAEVGAALPQAKKPWRPFGSALFSVAAARITLKD